MLLFYVIFALISAEIHVDPVSTVGTENGACSRLIAREGDPELDV